jgi:UDP-GlcNAc:undecaprenyl-phosphate/decaprenyl-phosphate GlcNAc-1-phosphate transferase
VALTVAFGLALGLALAATPLGVRLAWAVGYLDHPQARKLHTSATALLGGVVVFACALASWLLVHAMRGSGTEREAAFLLCGAVVALVLGLWDDRFGMQPHIKLLGQLAAGALLLASGVRLQTGLPVPLETGLTLIGLVALMNAVNFLDNMNGVVAGYAAVALSAFAWTSAARGATGLACAQLALAGACAGFLPWNFPRARIFLGDAGSLVLGYSLGASAVLAFARAPHGWGRSGVALMLAFPAFDMIFVVVNRLREGRKVYVGGKDHSNHRLASVLAWKKTVLLVWLSGAALCASGLVVLRLNQGLPTLLLWVPWTILLCWVGLRLSSVPVAPPPKVPVTPPPHRAPVASPTPRTSGSGS